MIEKKFKNLDEQIEIFKRKGLIICDETYAKRVLLRENYFFISGYRHLFLKSPTDKTYNTNEWKRQNGKCYRTKENNKR